MQLVCIFLINSPSSVLVPVLGPSPGHGHGPSPGPSTGPGKKLVPVLGPGYISGPGLGPGTIIFLVPAWVLVSVPVNIFGPVTQWFLLNYYIFSLHHYYITTLWPLKDGTRNIMGPGQGPRPWLKLINRRYVLAARGGGPFLVIARASFGTGCRRVLKLWRGRDQESGPVLVCDTDRVRDRDHD